MLYGRPPAEYRLESATASHPAQFSGVTGCVFTNAFRLYAITNTDDTVRFYRLSSTHQVKPWKSIWRAEAKPRLGRPSSRIAHP